MGVNIQLDGDALFAAFLGSVAMASVSFLFSVAMYILQSLGLYTIAERRKIKHPWMAWLPITNMWILGSIADQYQYVVKGQIRNRRKVLLGLAIAVVVVYVVMIGCGVSVFANVVISLSKLGMASPLELLGQVIPSMLSVLGAGIVMLVISAVAVVFQYIAWYNLFASCNPRYKVLFLVLSIFVCVTLPFLVFACRKNDLGMPPKREDAVQTPPAVPVADVTEEKSETPEE